MKTKTLPQIVRQVYGALGRSATVNHDPTDANQEGESGAHTFVDDVVDIVSSSTNSAQARCRLNTYLHEGTLKH